jgi:cell division protein FtsB
MASVADLRAVRRPARRRSRARARPGRLRWDRVSRIALLVVLIVLAALYIGPVQSFFSSRSEAEAQSAALDRLEDENRTLLERRRALRDPQVLEREARRLGMVRPDELPYSVEGLDVDR